MVENKIEEALKNAGYPSPKVLIGKTFKISFLIEETDHNITLYGTISGAFNRTSDVDHEIKFYHMGLVTSIDDAKFLWSDDLGRWKFRQITMWPSLEKGQVNIAYALYKDSQGNELKKVFHTRAELTLF